MPSTPPATSLRARTPPTPLHGAAYDTYEPYSPRRSKRSTAHSNPYSSFNGERSPKSQLQHTTPPPTTVKKARFARAPTQLSSPPSSPASPVKRSQLNKTPRKYSPRKTAAATLHSDSEPGSSLTLAPSTIDPTTMLPTPSKTPKKRAHAPALTSTSRILSFQPNHPNDVMPSPRKMKKTTHSRSMAGFDLYEDGDEVNGRENGKAANGAIEIFTDANARVPELDESEDNPFVGRKKNPPRAQRRSRKSREEAEAEDRIEEAAGREEGVVYVFRGKKIFRPFSPLNNADEDAASDLSGTPDQRRLKRQAGPAAQRPLTRSAIKPRLLFPSEEQRLEREHDRGGLDDVDEDEEAVTDIDVDMEGGVIVDPTPAKLNAQTATPPSTKKGKKKSPVDVDATPTAGDGEAEAMELGTDESFSSLPNGKGKGKGRSPFDAWARTKSGRKRAGDPVEEGVSGGGGKRTGSSGVGESSA